VATAANADCAAPKKPLRIVPFIDRNAIGTNATHPGPAGAHLTYYGGPVVSNVQVVVVFWGSNVSPVVTTGIYNFYSTVVDSTYLDLLYENSTVGLPGTTTNQKIGHGSVLGPITITPSSTATTITDTFIQTEIANQIAAGHLPPPSFDSQGNSNTLYALHFPPGVTISQGGSNSCVSGGFCAYHGTAYSSQNQVFQYSVLPDFGAGGGCDTGCGNSTEFNNITSVSSHELAETITDAQVGFATTNAPPLAWYDATNGEIGDICNALQGLVMAHGKTYTVQEMWSNQQGVCTDGPQAFFSVSTSPTTAAAGASVAVTVTVKNKGGQTLPFYTGTISFSSTDTGAQLPSSYTFAKADAGTQTFNSVTFSKAGTPTITVQDVDNPSITGSAIESVTAGKTTPTITWPTPAPITYGTALSATQLNATSSVAGTFVYSPAAGAILSAGPQTLRVTFAPTDTTNYTTASGSVTLQVNQATPAITWATPASITYGTALSAAQLNATSNVAGNFVYVPASGAILSAGLQSLKANFTPTDATNYLPVSKSVALQVNQATPAIAWATPAPVIAGTALNAAQLNATSPVPGTFAYIPPAGTIVSSGQQILRVNFTPTDTTNYTTASASVTLQVNQPATVQVSVGANPVGVSFTVDSQSFTSTQTLTWVIGSSHTIATTTPQTVSGGNLVFANWSDGGAISHSVTASAATPTYTANFSATTVAFQTLDTGTQGNWPNIYGQDGYIIANSPSSTPSYATVSFSGSSTWTWAASTSLPIALRKSPSTSDRIASTYYSGGSFTIDLALTGGLHQVALYLLDLDTTSRAETISILDPGNGNAVLDSRQFSSFNNGQYAVWNLQGHVLIQVTRTAGLNAVVGGLFFRTLGSANPPSVSITSPAPGVVTGPVTITAYAQSTAGIQSVQFLLDNANFGSPVTTGTGGNYSIPWATAGTSNGPHTLTAIALDTLGQSTLSAGVSVTVSNSSPPPSGSAVFLRTDTTTQGNWKSSYGADGSLIANDSSHVPSYATVGLGNTLQWTWAASTTDVRALTRYSPATGRIASAYYNTPSFAYDVNFTDGQPHQVALYLLDWDDGRIETVSILDAGGASVLDTHTLSGFGSGQYLVWNVQGHVLVKVQIVSGISAAASGLFFGAAGAVGTPPTVSVTAPLPNASLSNFATLTATASSSVGIASVQFVLDSTTNLGAPVTASPYTYQWNTALGVINGPHTLTAIATDTLSQQTTAAPVSVILNNTAPATSGVFVTKDTATAGTWKTHYGNDGQIIANDSNNQPTYAALNFSGASTWTWAANTGDPRAAQQAVGSGRIASTFYASNSFSLDVNLKDTSIHQLALYFLDWDDGGRAQTVTLLDANTQTVLCTQTLAAFQNGAYLVFNIKGHVTVQFNRLAGQNAVVSAVYLAPGS
jgi:hypothetical protein